MQVDGSYGNLMQGVSQQPNNDRVVGQCSAQTNMIADPVDGLKRRPPVAQVATLAADTASMWYDYSTGEEDYVVQFTDAGVKVFDITGVEKTVAKYNLPYLDDGHLDGTLALTTIGDYTVVANTTKLAAMTSDVINTVHGAVLYFNSAGENRQRYTVDIDSVRFADWTSPDIGDAGAAEDAWSIEYAVNQLYTQLVASAAATTYNFAKVLGCISVTRKSGTASIAVTISDGHSHNTTCHVVQNLVNTTAHLPKFGIPGQIVAITADGDVKSESMYLKFVVNDGYPNSFGSDGIWTESVKSGTNYKMDSATMPHALVRLPDGTFYFGPLDGSTHATYTLESWADQNTGGPDHNPQPSFIGNTINFVGTFQERLYILSVDVVSFSTTTSYFDFWKRTAVDILDSDPVEMISSADGKVVSLKYALQHNKHLVLFTKLSQFLIKGTTALTPTSRNMSLTTAFECDLTTKPVSGGDAIFFPISYGGFSGIQEFYTSSEVDTNNARAITEHVKRYLPGSPKQFAVNSALGYLLVRTEDKPSSVFLYQYLWQGTDRVQAAWSEFTFEGVVEYVFWVGSTVYFIISLDGNTHIVSLDMTDAEITGVGFNIHLDHRGLYTPVEKVVTLPFSTGTIDTLLAVRGADCDFPGMSIQILSVVGSTVTLAQDPGGAVYVGLKYTSSYAPSMPVIKDSQDRVITTDRLTLTRLLLTFKDTGNFNVSVNHPHYADTLQMFTGRVIGASANVVGQQPISSGIFRASVRRNTTDCTVLIYTDRYLPMTFTSIEWKGQYTRRGRRM